MRDYDFVKGEYLDRLFWGYIESMYNHGTNARVKVTHSLEIKTNKSIPVHVADLTLWDDVILRSEDIYSMIDLALQTRDENWFDELIECLETEEMA